MPEPQYPEHEKMAKIRDQSEAIGQFLDWLTDEKNLTICQNGIMDERPVYWSEVRDDFEDDDAWIADAKAQGVIPQGGSRYESKKTLQWGNMVHHYEAFEREGYYPHHFRIEELLAEHFEIDLKKIEAEKRAILDEFRRRQYGEETIGV